MSPPASTISFHSYMVGRRWRAASCTMRSRLVDRIGSAVTNTPSALLRAMLGQACGRDLDVEAHRPGRGLHLSALHRAAGVAKIGQDPDPPEARDALAQ